MTNYGDYEESLNDCVKSYRNAVKDNNAEIPQGFGMAFNYGYTFGMQQAKAEQKESTERQLDFQREHIATAALQGMLANSTWMSNMAKRYRKEYDNDEDAAKALIHEVAASSVELAYALINELNKKKDETNND